MWHLIIAAVLWGFSYVAIKIGLVALTPAQLVTARLALALPTLWIMGRLSGESFSLRRFSRREYGMLIFVGATLAFHLLIMAAGMRYTSASNTAWILAAAPIFIVALSRVIHHERLAWVQYTGMALAAFGVLYLVSNGDLASFSGLSTTGDLIVLTTDITWAIFTVVGMYLTQRLHPLVATFYSCAVAAIVMLPFLIAGGFTLLAPLHFREVGATVFLGVACLAFAFWFWAEGVKALGASRAGVYLYIEPVWTVLAAGYFLGEGVSSSLALAAALITVGVVMTERGQDILRGLSKNRKKKNS